MNLAEIRKKARRAREERGGPAAGAASPKSSNPPDPDAAPLEKPLDETADRENRAEPEPRQEEFPREEPGRQEPHSGGTAPKSAAPFDPLSVILAGRLAAGAAAEGTDMLADSREDAEDLYKYLRFRAADEDYGVSLLEIREIIKPRQVTEVPGMPGFVLGVISLRGVILPVMDLRLRLGLTAGEPSGRERIIIARKGEGMFGLLVDEVFQVMWLQGSGIKKAPPVLEGIDREFVSGIGRHGERMLIILDLEKVMDVSLR